MALGIPTLATPSVGSASASVTTATFLPTGSALLLAAATSRLSGVPGAITMSGGSLSWTLLATALQDEGLGFRNRAGAYAAIAPASPSNMTVQAGSTSAGKICLTVLQITGHGGVPGNSAASPHGTGDPTVVLGSAPAASSTVVMFGGFNLAGTVTPPAGFTEIDDFLLTDLIIHSCYDAVSAATSNAYSTTADRCVAIATEIVASGGGALRLRRRPAWFQHMMVR